MLWPQPDARSVRQPEPSAFGLLPGDLQPLASPDPLDPLVVDEPACSAQQLGDLAVAVASVLPSKLDESALSRSSSRPRETLRCVERCWRQGCGAPGILPMLDWGTRPKMAARAAIKQSRL